MDALVHGSRSCMEPGVPVGHGRAMLYLQPHAWSPGIVGVASLTVSGAVVG